MNCDFINSLTPEQKAELRKLLEEENTQSRPKYEVDVTLWDNGNIRSLTEYQDNQLHGKDIGWYEGGQKYWEKDYHRGQLHGKDIGWYENRQKYWEKDYHRAQLHGKSIGWCKNGQKSWERDYYRGQRVEEKTHEHLCR